MRAAVLGPWAQAHAEGSERDVGIGLAGSTGIVVETDPVHQKRTARLAAELGPETSGGLGHEPQHERRIVAWRAGAPDGCLDRGDELVQGEVFRAADLEYAAAGRGAARGEGDRSAPKLAARGRPGRL